MKKIISLLFFSLLSLNALANNCPVAAQLFYQDTAGQYRLSLPAGWQLNKDERTSQYETTPIFKVAAWGDHKHPIDKVRCHYYSQNTRSHIEIETSAFVSGSQVSSWEGSNKLYALCVSHSNNVHQCAFG